MRAKKPYHKRRPSKKQIELLCGEIGPGDGCDPRYDQPEFEISGRVGRKALQLCRQVREALVDAFSTTCQDPLLRELTVISVEPAPNTARLVVTLEWARDQARRDTEEVLAHLRGAAGMLRCEVAAAITRRKAPDLAFRVMAANR
jgi:ribosome-binding factor A